MTLIKKTALAAAFMLSVAWLLWGYGDEASRIGIVLIVWAAIAIPVSLLFGEALNALDQNDD